jgi:type IV pilus assembly protein PilC
MAGIEVKKIKSAKSSRALKQQEEATDIFAFLNKDIKLFPPRFNDKQKEAFYIELSIMISAGVDIRASLDLAESEQNNAQAKSIIKQIKENVIQGASLSEAMQKSGFFTSYEYHSIQIGEETGKLPQVLDQLATFFTKKLKQRRQFVSALSYPSVILFTSISAVTFMLYFIVPMFSDVFKRFGGELPQITQMIIDFSAFLSAYILYIAGCIALIVIILYLNRNKEWFQKYSAILISKIPLIGKIVTSLYLAQFCSSLALLVGARVPLLRSIQLVRMMINFYPIQSSLVKIEQDILQGKSLHASLSAFKVYDSRMVALIKVGEEVNQIDKFFEKLSVNYTDDVEHKTSLLSTFLEPLMIIFLGVVIGFILVAMYLPMFQLSTSIGG